MVGAHGFQNAEHARGIHVGGKFRGIERNLHMALCREVVDFGRLDFAYDLHKAHGVTHVGIMQVKIRLAFEVGYTLAKINRGAADDAVDFVTLGQQKFRKVRAVLTRDTGDEGYVTLCCHIVFFLFSKSFGSYRFAPG